MIQNDIQNQKDNRNIKIDKVGIKNISYPIIVEDRTNKTQHTIANIDIFVDLTEVFRGTHMSRFLEVLNSYHQEVLIDNLEAFLNDIKEKLGSNTAYINLSFPYFIKKIAPVSKIESLLNYQCEFSASLKNELDFIIGVTAPVTALCPCSKEISEYGAHNQRSAVTLKVKYKGFVWLEELIEYIESSASCEVFPLLKRVDEKFVTEQAYDNPYFVEDIVREIAIKVKEDKRITWFSVEAENFESIHNHSAYAFIEQDNV